jgi:hypothetical protein
VHKDEIENSGKPLYVTANRRLQPLGHVSGLGKVVEINGFWAMGDCVGSALERAQSGRRLMAVLHNYDELGTARRQIAVDALFETKCGVASSAKKMRTQIRNNRRSVELPEAADKQSLKKVKQVSLQNKCHSKLNQGRVPSDNIAE